MTPLLTAALYNNIEATRLLLGKPGIDAAWKNSQGRTAVDIAYLFDNSEIVRLFKEKGIEVLASKKEILSAEEINRALKAGESVVAKKNITYVETLSAKASDGFLSPVEAQGKAYLITPFCQIANAKITELKTFEPTKPEDLNRMVNSYQVRVLFSYTFNNYKNLSNIKIYMSQNGNILFPYAVRRTLSQPEAPGWANSGLIADFSGHEIDPTKPIEVRVITKAQKDLRFAFKNENGNNREYFVSENSKYKWE
jgi:ankyrin repeat protein